MADHQDVRGATRATVFKAGTPAATLTRQHDRTRFEYLDDYDGPPVATTLPRDAAPVEAPAGAVPPFFAGLLPEGRRLTALRQAVKTSADDELSLLLAVGGDTIGDVTLAPQGQEPVTPEPLVSSGVLRFADLLTSAGVVDRVGLPGVQEKASGAMISLPVRLDGVRAIIKLDPPEHPGAVENEDYFLRLARRLPVPVARAELVRDVEGRAGLVVERFDRVLDADAGVASLAVEDACQLLGRYPADKYAVSSEEVAGAGADACPARMVAARGAFVLFAFAWLTGNGDLHAKNLSVLQHPDGEWRLAPAYDLPFTLPYGDNTMALVLAGRRENVTRTAFRTFGGTLGLPSRAVERALDQVLTATSPLLDDLRDGALPLTRNATERLVRQLSRRRRDLEG